jgi:hypothetical protein
MQLPKMLHLQFHLLAVFPAARTFPLFPLELSILSFPLLVLEIALTFLPLHAMRCGLQSVIHSLVSIILLEK